MLLFHARHNAYNIQHQDNVTQVATFVKTFSFEWQWQEYMVQKEIIANFIMQILTKLKKICEVEKHVILEIPFWYSIRCPNKLVVIM